MFFSIKMKYVNFENIQTDKQKDNLNNSISWPKITEIKAF